MLRVYQGSVPGQPGQQSPQAAPLHGHSQRHGGEPGRDTWQVGGAAIGQLTGPGNGDSDSASAPVRLRNWRRNEGASGAGRAGLNPQGQRCCWALGTGHRALLGRARRPPGAGTTARKQRQVLPVKESSNSLVRALGRDA